MEIYTTDCLSLTLSSVQFSPPHRPPPPSLLYTSSSCLLRGYKTKVVFI